MTEHEASGLLDTNLLIDLVRVDPEDLPELPVICTITLAELSVGPLVAKDPAEQARRQQILQLTEATFDPLPFDAAAARAFGAIAASLRSAGRKPKARGYDALIAAVAVSRALPLHTANPADFVHIEGLDVRAVGRLPDPS